MEKQMILKPRLSEKTYGMSVAGNVFVFEVPGDANKHTVARAVAAQFSVTVIDVNIVNVKGKAKRTVRKGGRPTAGKRSDIKKAYVALKQGDTLPFFDVEEEAKPAKADKKAAKKAEKETK
jgi:large subunit ribosomal protein L23